jgi:hypothetical protein
VSVTTPLPPEPSGGCGCDWPDRSPAQASASDTFQEERGRSLHAPCPHPCSATPGPRRQARSPMTSYRNARQRHLAGILTHIQPATAALPAWRGEYLLETGRATALALWQIALPGQTAQWYTTREAECLVSGICLAVGSIWGPAAAPGGAPASSKPLHARTALACLRIPARATPFLPVCDLRTPWWRWPDHALHPSNIPGAASRRTPC